MTLRFVDVPRKKVNYIGAPKVFALEQACKHLTAAFGCFGCYVVGSALESPDWRDVDVRYMLPDEEFKKLFPHAGRCWEQDERWLLLTVAISEWMSRITGLPVDFQFQPQTHANDHHDGPRNPVGLTIALPEEPSTTLGSEQK